MAHVEGGWPKDIDPFDAEQVIRHRKKIERDEHYIRSIASLGTSIEPLIKENNAIDIYEEYFHGEPLPCPLCLHRVNTIDIITHAHLSSTFPPRQLLADVVADHSSEQPYARTLTVFRDPAPAGFKRNASYISWCPDGTSRKVAIAYSVPSFLQQPHGPPTASYVWDVSNPNQPDSELHSASQCVCVNFNTKDHNTLGAGLLNGQLAIFDPRKGSTPTATSPVERSHKDPIHDFAWLQSKTGTECASVSTDGYTFWWDTRKCVTVIFLVLRSPEQIFLFQVHSYACLTCHLQAW